MTYTNNTEHLSEKTMEFLAAWYQWTLDGAPEAAPFDRCDGLCHAADDYGIYIGGLNIQFREDDLDTRYPFGEGDYANAQDTCTMHLCPKRLAWVAAKLGIVQEK